MKAQYLSILASLTQTGRAIESETTFPGTAVSWGHERLDVVFTDINGNVLHKYHNGGQVGWNEGFDSLGLTLDYQNKPTAVSWAENRLDVFGVTSSKLVHRYWDGSSWQGGVADGIGEVLGEGISGNVAATSWSENRLDIIASNTDGYYVHKYYDGHQWQPEGTSFEDLGSDDFGSNVFESDPAAVSWGEDRLDIFGILDNGTLLHKYWDGKAWKPSNTAWEQYGDGLVPDRSGSPVATSWGKDRFDVWALKVNETHDDIELAHRFWDGSNLSELENLGGDSTVTPTVSHWDANRTDIFASTTGDAITYKYWDGYQWSSWNLHGPKDSSKKPQTSPVSASWAKNFVNVLYIDVTGNLRWQFWEGSQWLPSYEDFYSLGVIDGYDLTVATHKSKAGLIVQDDAQTLDL